MIYNLDRHHRRAMRLQGYDYGQAGAYYVTLCTHNRQCILGSVVNGEVHLSEHGQQVERYWLAMPDYHPVELDAYVIMPNHIHGIIVITQPPASVFEMIRRFKSFSAKTINKQQNVKGIPVWQTRYYDHIIRDEADLNRIREYIAHNPLKWSEDDYYLEA